MVEMPAIETVTMTWTVFTLQIKSLIRSTTKMKGGSWSPQVIILTTVSISETSILNRTKDGTCRQKKHLRRRAEIRLMYQ